MERMGVALAPPGAWASAVADGGDSLSEQRAIQ